jgi:hypothetical protein
MHLKQSRLVGSAVATLIGAASVHAAQGTLEPGKLVYRRNAAPM